MSTALVAGSLEALARQNDISLAESFLSADAIVLVDVSGSMATPDSREYRRRYDVACDELAQLQRTLPGKVAVVTFSDQVEFIPGGMPPFMGGGTNLDAALRFVRAADGTVRFIIISDGKPDNEQAALATAKQFTSKIDTIYVGPECEYGGATFLRRLAEASGGRYVAAERACELAERVEQLLLAVGCK
jgi:Mg-chelatase subunit ChlD